MAKKNAVEAERRVRVLIPLIEAEDMSVEVDQTEHVTINGETTIIRRGESVEVPVGVYEILKNRYPTL